MSSLENDDGSDLPFDFNLQLSSKGTKKKGGRPRKANVTKTSQKIAGSDVKNKLYRKDPSPTTSNASYDGNSKSSACEIGATKAWGEKIYSNSEKSLRKEDSMPETDKNWNGNGDCNNHNKLRGRNVARISKARIEDDDDGQDFDREISDKKSKKKLDKNLGRSNKKSTSTKKSIENDAVVVHSNDSDEDDKNKEEKQFIKEIQDGLSLFHFNVCYDLKYLVKNSYVMKSEPRGMVLICNITNIKGEMKRRGSEYDVQNLKNLFLRLGYKVKITVDCSLESFKNTLKQESTNKNLENMDSFILFIMTHGTSKDLLMQDGGKIQLHYVEEQLDGKNAPLLINKPKLIFVQACRKEPPGQKIEHDFAMRLPHDKQPHGKADIFISHSTYEGTYSARIPSKGTWFIRALVKVLEKHAHDWSYSEIMLCVHRIVNEIEEDSHQQIPQKTDSGRYNFIFSPIQIPSLISQADKFFGEEESPNSNETLRRDTQTIGEVAQTSQAESSCSNETLREQHTQPTAAASQLDYVSQARMNMVMDLYNMGPPQSAFDLMDVDVPFLS